MGIPQGRYVLAARRWAGKSREERTLFLWRYLEQNKSLGIDLVEAARVADHSRSSRVIMTASADTIERVAAALPAELVLEPEILHFPDVFDLDEILQPDATPAPFRVVAWADGPVADANVVIYEKPAKGHIRKHECQTNGQGRADFDLPSNSSVSRVIVQPTSTFWTMDLWHPNRSSGCQVDCRELPDAQDGVMWWHQEAGPGHDRDSLGNGIRIGVADTGCGWHSHLRHVINGGSICHGVRSPAGDGNDVSNHGTHVCGIIAARPVDRTNLPWGLAPYADVVSIRIYKSRGSGVNQADIADAIDSLVQDHGVNLVNLSLGSDHKSSILCDAIADATDVGAVCVVAAGNTGKGVRWPAQFEDCVAVGAVGCVGAYPDGTLARSLENMAKSVASCGTLFVAPFSCSGDRLDCVGPGVGIVSTVPQTRNHQGYAYAAMDGTSMATPYVAAVLARLLAKDPTYLRAAKDRSRYKRVREVLKAQCMSLGLPATVQGAGILRHQPPVRHVSGANVR